MINKSGKITAGKVFLFIFGLLILVGLFLLSIQSVGGWDALSQKASDFQRVESVGNIPSWMSFLNYIVGGIPNALIGEVGDMAAFVVVFVIFIMLALTFGDVISRFGAFSSWIGWVLGILLAVVGANLKLVTLIAVIAFSLVAGAGVLSVTVGLITPFVIFAVAHFMVLRLVSDWLTGVKSNKQVVKTATEVKDSIKGLREIRNAFK